VSDRPERLVTIRSVMTRALWRRARSSRCLMSTRTNNPHIRAPPPRWSNLATHKHRLVDRFLTLQDPITIALLQYVAVVPSPLRSSG
jgi:hypothetical protein